MIKMEGMCTSMWKRAVAVLMLTLLLVYQPISQVRASPVIASSETTQVILQWDPPSIISVRGIAALPNYPKRTVWGQRCFGSSDPDMLLHWLNDPNLFESIRSWVPLKPLHSTSSVVLPNICGRMIR